MGRYHSIPIIANTSQLYLTLLSMSARQETQAQEQQQLLCDILDTLSEINPMLRSIIQDQGQWDIDRLEARLRQVLQRRSQFAIL